MLNINKSTIGNLLFKKIYTSYVITLVFFIIFQIYFDYNNIKDENRKTLIKIENAYKEIFEKYIVSEEKLKLKQLSESIFETTDICGIAIVSKIVDDFVFINGKVDNRLKDKYKQLENNILYSTNLLEHKFTLNRFENSYIEIYFYIDLDLMQNNIYKNILFYFINLLLGLVILWVLFTYYSNQYLVKPLHEISEATKKFDIEEHEFIEIKLETSEKNEFNLLAETFNKMSKRINESYINMQQLSMIREIQKEKLETQKEELIEANKARDDFLANMSHELKTPLNSINLISDVMKKNKVGNLDEKQVKNLEIINKCGKDLLNLINEVLDISKLEAGELLLNSSTFNIKDTMDSIYDMFYPLTKDKELVFEYFIDESLKFINSDEDRIKQVIKNLLSNAIKFTDSGEIRFIVKNDDKNIIVIVEDEGIGIPEDKLEHIFDRFKQVDGSTTRKYGGTGLGLAISKELAYLLEGILKVTSKEGIGSKFEFIFPKNEDRIQGFENLILKKSSKTDDIKEEMDINFIDFDNINDRPKTDDRVIYVFNNDPVQFINVIIELAKRYEVKQFNKIDELINVYKEKKSNVLIDLTTINDDIKNKIVKNIEHDLIVLHADNNLDEDISSKTLKSYVKPLSKDDLSSI